MPLDGQTFYIAGAGISGLTLALSLAQRGATVVVLERSAAVSEFGAGLQVSPNARKILNQLGLDEALAMKSLEPEGLDVFADGFRPLVTMEFGAIMRERFGAAYAVMHRADLADLLYKACRRHTRIDLVFGVRSWDVVSHARGVTVSIDEADGQSRTSRGSAFIGADGVHSRTRTTVLGGAPARYGHRIAWRTLVPADLVSSQIRLDSVSVLLGPNYHMVCYPLPHRRQVNLALFSEARQHEAAGTQPVLPKGARRSAAAEVLLAAAGDSWTPWPLYTVSTPRWHDGNIALLGDAAHAMVPFQAQGAAMGIEDAAVLAAALERTADAVSAFRQYELARRDRVSRVANTSLTNGRIFHMRWPLTVARDLAISLGGSRGHLKRLAWIYGYEVPQYGIAPSAVATQR